MGDHFQLHLDKAGFDRWLAGQERKYEWKDGRVVQMSNVTRGHASVVSNILYELRRRLDPAVWAVMASDFGVEADAFVRFPDVLVEPRQNDLKGRRSASVALMFEVLSPSSIGTDLLDKPAEYASFATLKAYVVASQEQARCWLWQRHAETGSFPHRPVEIAGRDQSLPLADFGIVIPLDEIYMGVPTVDD